ncbi:unnamed protein product [Bursaphelenchus okinawaensis]|uniref:LIM zinc-binding domain-containing protein n=1 Tax=Bursaphelenchus okinawaensis TaxID=465554 RepID=A0A811K0P1_9BILA|nr:unnamed protein product [Bursaphelenchus okinawaensis]CAG9088244.1 unnamed protein product [Bursaphelenchus okinawaensis]
MDFVICLNCQSDVRGPICNGCKEPVFETFIEAKGKAYHFECLLCSRCCQPFPGGEFYEMNGALYDGNCYWAARLVLELDMEANCNRNPAINCISSPSTTLPHRQS